MLEENARVIKSAGNSVLVEIFNRSACETCSARKGCGQSLLSKITGSKRTKVQALNAMNFNLHEGDEVVLGLEESSLLKASAIAYLLPVLGLVLGVVFGNLLEGSEPTMVAMAVLGLAMGLGVVYIHGHKTGQNDHYQPMILRALGNGVKNSKITGSKF